jgi:cobalamin synthase
MYTLFFIEVGLPLLDLIPVPASSSKTLIMTLIYAIPLIVLIVGLISLILAAIKKEGGYYV